uniref:Neuronal acetylcholine receptor subunit alpha-3 n=1 Tax=Caligus clemensi TaxID=344056 RepID=C1C246_CALCM|nr:Neuronal acetylcholine receptor subunit alpha-3 precursor [Caligus clemensi]
MLALSFVLQFLFLGVVFGSPKEILIGRLFKNYDPAIPPSNSEGIIGKVDFNIRPQCMELSLDGELEGNIWAYQSWQDDRLAWNSSEESGIELIRVPAKKIWLPDVVLYMKKSAQLVDEEYNAVVYSSGRVIYVPDIRSKMDCDNANLTNPWAVNECNLRYGSWTFDSRLTQLSIGEHSSDETEYTQYCSIKTLEIKEELKTKVYDCCPEPYSHIEYKLRLQRKFLRTDQGIVYNPMDV